MFLFDILHHICINIFHYNHLMVLTYFIGGILGAASIATYQEYKIWQPVTLRSLNIIGIIKVFVFNIYWMIFCFIGTLLLLPKYVLTFGNTDIAMECNRYVEYYVAKICVKCIFGNVTIINGIENLPPPSESSSIIIPAPVYIANHVSQIDIGSVYTINRRFKWIAKESVLYIPGVGQVMYLSKHVLINRTNTKKQSTGVNNLYSMSNDAIQSGIPMFVYPQGTRSIAKQLPFKDGAFIIAQTNKCPIIPISIDIPYNSNKTNPWNSFYPINLLWGGIIPTIKITIHKPIQVTGTEDIKELKEQCKKIIYSVLPPEPSSTMITTTTATPAIESTDDAVKESKKVR